MKDYDKKIQKLNPLKMSDEDIKFAEERCFSLYNGNRPLFEKARAVVIQLGQGGMWRGYEASILIVANALGEAKHEN